MTITPKTLRKAARDLWAADALLEECNYESSEARKHGWTISTMRDPDALDTLAAEFTKLAEALENGR